MKKLLFILILIGLISSCSNRKQVQSEKIYVIIHDTVYVEQERPLIEHTYDSIRIVSTDFSNNEKMVSPGILLDVGVKIPPYKFFSNGEKIHPCISVGIIKQF